MSGLIRFIHKLLQSYFFMFLIKVIVFPFFFASKAVGYPTIPKGPEVPLPRRKVAQEHEPSGLQK